MEFEGQGVFTNANVCYCMVYAKKLKLLLLYTCMQFIKTLYIHYRIYSYFCYSMFSRSINIILHCIIFSKISFFRLRYIANKNIIKRSRQFNHGISIYHHYPVNKHQTNTSSNKTHTIKYNSKRKTN